MHFSCISGIRVNPESNADLDRCRHLIPKNNSLGFRAIEKPLHGEY
jgi:hypothetical protein